ncbi:MAG TPA: hypothetical protein VJ846_09430 [Sphingomicrobium sp.]|nr:hypothetical protein [Sphingomicrobium sp.]
MNNNEIATQFDSVMHGVRVWSERMHPVYDAIAEVRLMPNGLYQIFHHYGEGSIPWADEIAAPSPGLEQSVAIVRGYQRAFSDKLGKHKVAGAPGRMQMSLT